MDVRKTITEEYGADNVGRYINKVLIIMSFCLGLLLGLIVKI